MTRALIRAWLLNYAWMGSTAEQEANVDCIMSQDDWRHVETTAERFAGAQFEPGPAAMDRGQMFALSALYECHDGPHTLACPSRSGDA